MDEEGSIKVVNKFTRRALYDIAQSFQGKKIDEKFSSMEEKLMEISKWPVEQRSILSRALKNFKSDFKKKWAAASYKEERFLKNNEQWLTSFEYLSRQAVKKSGRPSKNFEDLSDRSKRRKTKDLREQVSSDELIYAAGMSQRAAGNSDVSKIIKEITTTPTRAKKIRKALISVQKQPIVKKYTPQEALAIFIEGNFTRRQWEVIQSSNKTLYPCYSLIKKAKKDCYPQEEQIQVTETCAEVQLQGLLDHTILRLHKYIAEVMKNCTKTEKENLVLITKWGCDGSQQTQYKQKFQNPTDSDANIFQSSLVPLRLVVIIDEQQKKVIRQNPVPSSVRFCRPIRIRFINESNDVTREEMKYIEDQVKNLKKTEIPCSDETLKIKHVLVPTMVDGKVCNAATSTTSTMRCYICGQTSKEFNNLDEADDINVEALQFGLSILHARIRFFESILHLSYKLPIRKWQARTVEEKNIVKETKEKIQRSFKEEMGLLVDVPKPGLGNSNDGNTSRRFFADPETASRITGVNADLIKRLKIILEVISSGFGIDVEKFAVFAHETAKMYVELYEWYPMSPTIHKILMHGSKVISHAILPIGQLSEEVAEARNKHFRQYRSNFARKFSRVQCNTDIINKLLLSSDPYISSNRPKQHKKSQPFSKEAMSMMAASTPTSPPRDNNENVQVENVQVENVQVENDDQEDEDVEFESD